MSTASSGTRLVVFTSVPRLEARRWWSVITRMPGLERILLVRRVPRGGAAAALRSLGRNIRKHGPLFLPYRVWWGAVAAWRKMVPLRAVPFVSPIPLPVDVLEAEDIHAPECVDRVRAWAPTMGLSLGAPVLREALFSIPPAGTINVHLGKVPEFRGAPPGFWELYHGVDTVGVTIHRVDVGLDTGPILASATAPIYAADSLDDVVARAEELGRELLARALNAASAGTATWAVQPPGGRTNRLPTVTTRLRLGFRLVLRRTRRTLLSVRWLAKTVAGLVVLGVVRPWRDAWRSLWSGHPVRVFTFHRVTELCRDGMTVSPRVLQRQVRYLARTHDVVTLERALEILERRERLRRPAAVLTFDDAYGSVMDEAAPVLREAGVPGCVFACSDYADTDRRYPHDDGRPMRDFFRTMRWSELRQLVDWGWSIGSHTANHVRLSQMTGEPLRTELERPRAAFRERLPRHVDALAYPFGQQGDVSEEALRVAQAGGYRACFSDYGGENDPRTAAPFRFVRIELGGDHPTLAWKLKAQGLDLARFG